MNTFPEWNDYNEDREHEWNHEATNLKVKFTSNMDLDGTGSSWGLRE